MESQITLQDEMGLDNDEDRQLQEMELWLIVAMVTLIAGMAMKTIPYPDRPKAQRITTTIGIDHSNTNLSLLFNPFKPVPQLHFLKSNRNLILLFLSFLFVASLASRQPIHPFSSVTTLNPLGTLSTRYNKVISQNNTFSAYAVTNKIHFLEKKIIFAPFFNCSDRVCCWSVREKEFTPGDTFLSSSQAIPL